LKKIKIVYLVCVFLIAGIDLLLAYGQALIELSDRTTVPLHSLGYQFMGLEGVFKDVHTVGYFTDKDLDKPLAVAQFEQAQYMLVPTVLDLNNTQYHWVIFDCTTPQIAMENIKRLGFTPVKMHNGIILAFNPYGE